MRIRVIIPFGENTKVAKEVFKILRLSKRLKELGYVIRKESKSERRKRVLNDLILKEQRVMEKK